MAIQSLHSLELIINHGVLNKLIYKLNKSYCTALVNYIIITNHSVKINYQLFQLYNNSNKNIHGNHLSNLSNLLMLTGIH